MLKQNNATFLKGMTNPICIKPFQLKKFNHFLEMPVKVPQCGHLRRRKSYMNFIRNIKARMVCNLIRLLKCNELKYVGILIGG